MLLLLWLSFFFMLWIISINHRWSGTAAILSIREDIKIVFIAFFVLVFVIQMAVNTIIDDAIDWIMKYLIIVFFFVFFWGLGKMVNAMVLTSIMDQINNQEFLMMSITGEMLIVIRVIGFNEISFNKLQICIYRTFFSI